MDAAAYALIALWAVLLIGRIFLYAISAHVDDSIYSGFIATVSGAVILMLGIGTKNNGSK